MRVLLSTKRDMKMLLYIANYSLWQTSLWVEKDAVHRTKTRNNFQSKYKIGPARYAGPEFFRQPFNN